MKVKSVLVSQPRPAVIEKSPFYELSQKHHVEIAYRPFIRVEGVSLKEFRAQRVEILTHTAVIFTSRTTVDSFFHICEEARITVPETMKYICQTEAVALYLQKYIVYRKRKISFADGSFTSLIELIIKHKEEKFLLALSEPHKPELPETLAKLKLSFDPVILARTVAGDLDDVKMADYDLLAAIDLLLAKDKLTGNPCIAHPDEWMCNGCSSCEKVCPYGAITYVDKEVRGPGVREVRRIAQVNEAVCQGCGACTVTCPSGAMDLKGFANRQIIAEVDAICKAQ